MLKRIKEFQELMGIDPEEHIGNMWGWKVSYWGLGVLVFLIALYYYRITYHPLPIDGQSTTNTEEVIQKG